jgi:hypothetical protein
MPPKQETGNIEGLHSGMSFIAALDMDVQQVSTDLVAVLAMDSNYVRGIDGLRKDPITRLLKDSCLA